MTRVVRSGETIPRPGDDAWKSGVAGSSTNFQYNDYSRFALPKMGGRAEPVATTAWNRCRMNDA